MGLISRASKGSSLTWAELDYNFNYLNAAMLAGIPANMNGGTINATPVGKDTPSTGAFTTLSASGIATFAQGTTGQAYLGLGTALTSGAGANDTSIRWDGTSGSLLFSANNLEKARIDATGNLGIGVTPTAGINASLQIKDGIKFPATQVPSSDPNTLDDCRRGTWTPTQGAGLTVVGAFSSSGSYVKVGRQVTVSGQLNGATSVAVAAAGGLLFTNLPFTAAVVAIGNSTNASNNLVGSVAISGASMYSNNVVAATASLYFTATYFV